MLLAIPEIFVGIGYYQGISLVLWIISIALSFLCFILFIKKSQKMDLKSQKMLYNAYGLFFLFFGFTRIFFITAVYQTDACTDCYDIYTILGYIAINIGIVFWLYVLETHLIKKTKKIFLTIAMISLGVTSIALIGIIKRETILDIISVLLIISLLEIIILYIYLILKSTGSVRIKSIWLLIGMLLMFLGYSMDSEFFFENFPGVPLEISPIIMCAGILIFLFTQLYEK
ncbi:MAG: hypothetical protein ACTSPD_06120 [Promethearchaeota archaeon]